MHLQVRRRGRRAGQAVAQRIGIFGGSFNPPHMGHLICAQEAHSQLGLDVVVWVPVGRPSHRTIEDDPGAEERLTMCEWATSADGRFAVSRTEIDREGLAYTVETLRSVRESAPDDELVLILGGDQAAALAGWHEPAEILDLATLAVTERAGHRREEVAEVVQSLAGAGRLVFFDMPRVDISSTLVRERAAAGRPIRYLVPDKVANYVGAQGLYHASHPAGVS